MSSSIALIMDRHFGRRVIELARQMPVWIVSSATNDAAVAKARAMLGIQANLTTFFQPSDEAKEDAMLRALCAIDEHHGPESSSEPYEELVVIGAEPPRLTRAMMKDLGFERISGFDSGFRLSKLALDAKAAQ